MTTPLQPGITPSDPVTNVAPTGPQTQPNVIINSPPANQQYFTSDQLEAARQQEKDKLYARQQRLEEQLKNFQTQVESLAADKATREKEAADAKKAADEETRKAAEAKMSAEQLIETRKAEWEAEKEKFRADLELQQAIMQKEQQLYNLKAFAQRRVAEEIAKDTIVPGLEEFVNGNTEEEIEASITKIKEKSANIIAGMNGAPAPAGVSPTGFAPTGPLDTLIGTRQLSLDDINNMSMEEYAQVRSALGPGRAGSNKGLLN